MGKVERVEFIDATKQFGPPNEPARLWVKFNLTPVPDGPWVELFKQKLLKYNLDTKNSLEKGEEFSASGENDDSSTWKFSLEKENSALTHAVIVEAHCHSTSEIELLHETLKDIVRRTNGAYPNFAEKLSPADAKELAEKKEIEKLKKNLKSDL